MEHLKKKRVKQNPLIFHISKNCIFGILVTLFRTKCNSWRGKYSNLIWKPKGEIEKIKSQNKYVFFMSKNQLSMSETFFVDFCDKKSWKTKLKDHF